MSSHHFFYWASREQSCAGYYSYYPIPAFLPPFPVNSPLAPAIRRLHLSPAMKQQHLFKPHLITNKKFFGGSLLYGRRKGTRPMSTDQALHLVLKSQWATANDRFTSRANKPAVEEILKIAANKYGIRIYQQAICGNHIHLLIRAKRRWLYRAFIAVVTGLIAQQVMRKQSYEVFMRAKSKEFAGEGVPKQENGQAFWQHRPFSRIVNWGRDYQSCLKYLTRNTLEALGFIKYKKRRDYYASWRIELEPEPSS